MNDDDLKMLRSAPVPGPGRDARARAVEAALESFDAEKNSSIPKGSAAGRRLSDRMANIWSGMMEKKLMATPAIAGLVALPIAGYVGWQMLDTVNIGMPPLDQKETREQAPKPEPVGKLADKRADGEADEAARELSFDGVASESPAPALPATGAARDRMYRQSLGGHSKTMVSPQPNVAVPDPVVVEEESRDRFENFDTNPVRSALENPVSTFSIDVDTASYALVRRTLKEGVMPNPDAVRVEEMINYFPYDWRGPEGADQPFNSTITVTPSPWNDHTKLMHVAIKGYDVKPAEKPKSNLVFLLDVSGSMNAPDKLPLLKNAFRLLVDRLDADDTVSIVTYAGNAGTVLENAKGSDKAAILDALDNLEAGGRTAGEEGIREAYRLAEKSFVKDGVNRVMLATDGDFNIGQTSDDELKRLIEEKRESGVYLSVFGFGRGNLNDQMMQTIAQNGNGTAAYIDTLAEAEKTLVQEAGSTMFPIANDVKIQVEFNPQQVSEYRLIGYETRALNREDFNNDRVDAGDIGSGHSVTAIYEITPNGSPAELIDDLRYGQDDAKPAVGDTSDEYAFVKIRYKLPGEDVSKLITTPVTAANEVDSFANAAQDVRFSIAVAAFGQKLRKTDQTASFDYDRIMQIATAARGSDPYGYRAEFLSLVRLASALDSRR
ncbi:MAG: VWA domain-containing protein [Rhizobiaceae bacterium]|nr:VWA domain-containing protein [Rhizobiaceae bacterium]